MRVVAPLWVACAVVLLLRRPDLIATPQLYAEDGLIFFRDAILSGLPSLLAPYAGYHHLIPRAIALIASPFPAAIQPAAYVAISVALAAACCALLAPLLHGVIVDRGLRAFVAIGVAAAVPADEIIGSVASLQWYLHLPVLAASLVPLAAGARVAARVAAVLVGATTPQGLIAAPIAAVLWWRRPARHDPWIATLYAGTALVNIATAPHELEHATPHLFEALATVMAFRVGDALTLGKAAAENLAVTGSAAGTALGLAMLAALLLALAWRRGRAVAAVFVYVIVAPVALVLATRSFDAVGFAGYAFFGADRYFVAPCAAVVVALAALAASIGRATLARAAAVAALCASAYANFREPRVPSDDHWLAAAPAVDAWRDMRNAGIAAPRVSVYIPPARWPLVLPSCEPGGRGGPFPGCP